MMKARIAIHQIDGAITFSGMEIKETADDTFFKAPPMNKDYKYLAYFDDMPFVSKDKKEWVIAMSVLIDGEKVNPSELQPKL